MDTNSDISIDSNSYIDHDQSNTTTIDNSNSNSNSNNNDYSQLEPHHPEKDESHTEVSATTDNQENPSSNTNDVDLYSNDSIVMKKETEDSFEVVPIEEEIKNELVEVEFHQDNGKEEEKEVQINNEVPNVEEEIKEERTEIEVEEEEKEVQLNMVGEIEVPIVEEDIKEDEKEKEEEEVEEKEIQIIESTGEIKEEVHEQDELPNKKEDENAVDEVKELSKVEETNIEIPKEEELSNIEEEGEKVVEEIAESPKKEIIQKSHEDNTPKDENTNGITKNDIVVELGKNSEDILKESSKEYVQSQQLQQPPQQIQPQPPQQIQPQQYQPHPQPEQIIPQHTKQQPQTSNIHNRVTHRNSQYDYIDDDHTSTINNRGNAILSNNNSISDDSDDDGAGHSILISDKYTNGNDDEDRRNHSVSLLKSEINNSSSAISYPDDEYQKPLISTNQHTPTKGEQHVHFNENILKYSSVDPDDYDDNTDSSLNESDFVSADSDLYPTPDNVYEKILNTASKLRFEASMHEKELKLTGAYLACFISLGISVGSLGPTLPALAKNTNSTIAQVGYFFSARGIGYFLGSLTGRFYDRLKNGNLIIGASVLLLSVALLLIPLVKNVWVAGLLFFIEGIGAGAIDAGLNTMIVWIWKKSVNPFMQLLHFSFGIGALLAPFIISMIVEQTLFIKYMILSIIMMLAFIPVILTKSVPPYLEDESSAASLTPNEKRLRIEVIVSVAMFLFLYVGAEAGYGGWVFTYAQTNLNMSDQSAGLLNSLFWTTFTLARLAGVFISMYLSPNQMVILDMIGCFFFSTLLIIAPKSEAILWIATAGLGIALASIFPTAISLPQNLNMPVTGEATSYMVIGATAGEISIPWLIGVAQHHISEKTLPWVVLLCCFVTLGIYLAINIRAKIMRSRDRGDKFEMKGFNQFITTIQHQ